MRANKYERLFFLISFILFMSSCNQQQKQGYYGGPVPVNLTTVTTEHVVYYNTYPGTVTPLNEVEMHSEVSGFITGISFTEGTHVEKGQKLYEIDRIKYQANYDQAKATVDIAEANLEKAKRDAIRYSKLEEQDAIAKQIVDDSKTAEQNAQLQLVAARANLQKAESDLNYSLLKAPFSGTIGISQVKLGAFINAGQTILNTLSSTDPIGVDILADEKDLGRFLQIKEMAATDNDSTFRLVLAGNSVYPQPGIISVIDRAIDPQTGTIRVRIIFPNKNGTLRDGMNCTVKVLNRSSGERIVIPYKAVIEQMSEYFVFVADSGKVHQQRIEPGLNLGDKIVVNNGLKPGEKIVLDGVQKLRDGSQIITDQDQGTRKSGYDRQSGK